MVCYRLHLHWFLVGLELTPITCAFFCGLALLSHYASLSHAIHVKEIHYCLQWNYTLIDRLVKLVRMNR